MTNLVTKLTSRLAKGMRVPPYKFSENIMSLVYYKFVFVEKYRQSLEERSFHWAKYQPMCVHASLPVP
jgi:hypothetical protein